MTGIETNFLVKNSVNFEKPRIAAKDPRAKESARMEMENIFPKTRKDDDLFEGMFEFVKSEIV